jgi:hypothetical protein
MALAVFMPNQNLTGFDSDRKPARAAKGATFFNRPSEPPMRYVFQPPFTAPLRNVRSIIEDTKGNIWLGGGDGLWRFDRSTFTNFTTDFVGYIYEDKNGNLWTSSAANGRAQTWVISRYDEKSLHNANVAAIQIRTEKGMFFGILEDKDGGIWFGSLNGVRRYDGKSFDYFEREVRIQP